jgi:imidazole glycerol-phosphate synthase subunit HisH
MIIVIDYGMGNLRSAQKGLEKSGHEAVVSSDAGDIAQADGILLPGVGAFKDCYDGLKSGGFVEPLLNAVDLGVPLLGICVGMQMLFDYSEEGEGSPGLGLLQGRVVRFAETAQTGLKVPHMGWNRLEAVPGRSCPLLENLSVDPYVYFVHSYFPNPNTPSNVYATATYGISFPAVVGRERIFGTQFHPEKSQREGIGILSAFGDFVRDVSGRIAK